MSLPNIYNFLVFGDLTVMSLSFNTFSISLVGNSSSLILTPCPLPTELSHMILYDLCNMCCNVVLQQPYPISFNTLYGHSRSTYLPKMFPNLSSMYG